MKYFTRKALIRIETDKISFNILNVKDDSEDSFLVFPFDKIKSYNIQFLTDRFACLIIYSNSGNKKEFSFLTKKQNDLQSDTGIVIKSIHTSFRQFNFEHRQIKTIEFKPSFYASKNGLYTIVVLVLLSIITIVLAI